MVSRIRQSLVCLSLGLALSSAHAHAEAVSAIADMAALGARPAALGGWHGVGMFGAQGLLGGAPLGDFEHLAFSHTHSLRHFPHGKKNLDQLDADPMSVMIPLNKGNSMVGGTFSLSGELGLDHRDSNGLLKKKHWLRGKAREVFYAAVAGKLASAETLTWASAWEQWQDGTVKTQRVIMPGAQVMGLGSSRWRWSFGLKRAVPVEGEVKAHWLWNLGAAYQGKHGILGVLSLLGRDLSTRRLGGGVEKSAGPHLRLRAGYGEGPTYGWGLKLGDFLVDYAVMKNVMPSLSAQPFPRFKDAHLLTYGFSF